MEATLLLANSAEAGPNGLMNALGLGWTVTGSPTPPAALVVFLKVPWDQTNNRHELALHLVDSDGHPVLLGRDEAGEPAPLQIAAQFEVGRPPGIPHGTAIDQSLCIDIGPGMPLVPDTSYQWRLQIDEEESAVASFFVRPNA